MPSLGPLEILVIFIVALLVFGPNKLPELARQVGKGLAEFRRVQHHLRGELDDAIHSVMDDDKPKVEPPVVTEPPPQAVDRGPAVPNEPVTVESNESAGPTEVPARSAETDPVAQTPLDRGPTPPPLADDA
ncbi:MAG: twin-arginine translocase TatA/TatE family subunit [Acidimicrobiia bacterium]